MTSFARPSWPAGLLASAAALYLVLAFGLLAPMASDLVLPGALDHANHTAIIVEAKMALNEGQFPLRVAPFEHDRLRYPLFQFYSSTPYLIGGLIYKYITPQNPWFALKLVYLLGICVAGIFVFKVGEIIGFDAATSVLMGVVYITAPYLLVNILARGAYTEVFAQFVIPILAYTSLRLVQHPTGIRYAWASLPWVLLGTSHVITFVYGTVAYLVLLALFYFFRRISLHTALILGAACGLGWCVSAFQWFPAATVGPLQVHYAMGNIFEARWLTPLSTLLAPTSAPVESIGRDTPPFLSFSIGVPFLIAFGGLLYLRRRLGSDATAVWPLLLAFCLAFICVWSPFDFWSLLPSQLRIAQFPYRFLVYTAAIGTLLFGYFVDVYKRNCGPLPFLGCLVGLVLLANPYLPSLQRNTRSLSSIIANPVLGYAGGAYLYNWELRATVEDYRGKYEASLPLTAGDNWLLVKTDMPLDRDYIEKSDAQLILAGDASALAGACRKLDLTLDDVVIASRDIAPGPFEWRVPNTAFRRFQNQVGELAFKSECGFVPAEINPASSDKRLLWIRVTSLKFQRSSPESGPGGAVAPSVGIMAVADTRPHCKVIRSVVNCDVNAATAVEAQLPVLYYPSLLRITVNGKKSPYSPSADGAFVLALVLLKPGQNHISASFAGSRVGNVLSLIGILAVVIVSCLTPLAANHGGEKENTPRQELISEAAVCRPSGSAEV